jgi:hypothetical protein
MVEGHKYLGKIELFSLPIEGFRCNVFACQLKDFIDNNFDDLVF